MTKPGSLITFFYPLELWNSFTSWPCCVTFLRKDYFSCVSLKMVPAWLLLWSLFALCVFVCVLDCVSLPLPVSWRLALNICIHNSNREWFSTYMFHWQPHMSAGCLAAPCETDLVQKKNTLCSQVEDEFYSETKWLNPLQVIICLSFLLPCYFPKASLLSFTLITYWSLNIYPANIHGIWPVFPVYLKYSPLAK